MEFSSNAGSCLNHNQHSDVLENCLNPITNEMFTIQNEEVNSTKVAASSLSSSSVELFSPAPEKYEGHTIQNNTRSPQTCHLEDAQEISEEPCPEIPSIETGELNASVLLRGEEFSSAEFIENYSGFYKNVHRNEDAEIGEAGSYGSEEEKIKAEVSSCDDRGFTNTCSSVGHDGYGSGLNSGIFDPGLGLAQETDGESNVPNRRDATVNYVLDSAKSVALLIENLCQLPRVLKEWTSKTLLKPKAIHMLAKNRVEKDEAENFVSEGPCIAELHNERENTGCEDLVGALGFPLGMSIATVLAEILASNFCLKQNMLAEEISELLGLAIKESLNQVLGSECNCLVRDFEVAFTSTFKTITRVRQLTAYPKGKKISTSDGQMPELATVGHVNDVKVEYADSFSNLGVKFREKRDCERLFEQPSGSLGCVQGSGMKGVVQQFCKPSFTNSDVQVISNLKDRLPYNNCREHGGKCSCITETMSVKDCNNLTCQMNEHPPNVIPSHWEKGFFKNEIEDISKNLENIKLESADCNDVSMGNIPSVPSDIMTSTARNIGDNDSDLANAIYENGITSSMPGTFLNQQVVLHGKCQRQLANSIVPHSEWTQSISNVFEKSVMEQERCNNLREVEIGLAMRHLRLKEAKMHVDVESNELTRQSIHVNQSKALFKESKFIDKKLNSTYVELNRTCSDHLVAGLVLMLFALAYGSWKYSYTHLSQAIELCQASKVPRKWLGFNNPMDSVMGHIQTFLCEITVIGRMLLGLAVIAIFAISLLRRSVSSSSQAMPTTIILIVLGLVCGYFGKLSVDNLGGSGFHWLVHWEVLCFLHAFSACFPALLIRVVNGPTSAHEGVKESSLLVPLGIRKFMFHIILLVLPVMAGLTPFASAREWTNHFYLLISDNVLEPARISFRDSIGHFLAM